MQIPTSLQERLHRHPIYAAVRDLDDLRRFMQCHVYSVWDFMSLIKYLQRQVAPTAYPWTPRGDGDMRRFINELVLEEESDRDAVGKGHCSHFELYQQAMCEIGADIDVSRRFIQTVAEHGLQEALALPDVPAPSRRFMEQTFAFIAADQPHVVAAALALGREHIIPDMFRAILERMGVTAANAPVFHHYLNRHVALDEDFHAPMSLRLLAQLCGGDAEKRREAEDAARRAVEARIEFWDGVLDVIRGR